MPGKKIFPAKILLAGEYTVIDGGQALTIPFDQYYGSWSTMDNGLDYRILDIYNSLIKEGSNFPWLDFKTWYSDIHLGKYFLSNIPEGFGLGSSGALCAGIYDRYALDDTDIPLLELKKRLAALEHSFHGKSSGLDPLVSYVQRPLISTISGIFIQDKIYFSPAYIVFLLDSRTARKAEFLIKHFQVLMQEKYFSSGVRDIWLPAVNTLVECWLDPESQMDPWSSFYAISTWQLENMSAYITTQVSAWWKEGLFTKQYLLKLCGAGGGGYYLGICPRDQWKAIAARLPVVPVSPFIPSSL